MIVRRRMLKAFVEAYQFSIDRARAALGAIRARESAASTFEEDAERITRQLMRMNPVDRARTVETIVDTIIDQKYRPLIGIDAERLELLKSVLQRLMIEYLESYPADGGGDLVNRVLEELDRRADEIGDRSPDQKEELFEGVSSTWLVYLLSAPALFCVDTAAIVAKWPHSAHVPYD